MNYLDLFSGAGGFHEGLKRAGFKFDWVGYSEIDKHAIQVYRKHFPTAEYLGSIVDIRPGDLPEIDLVTFGFPCVDLSVAGQRRGLAGKRSGLFFEALRIIEDRKPKIFIFENVKGLYSSENGRDFETVLRAIAGLRLYECEWGLVNTRWLLPQNRERIYFIGYLAGRGGSRPKVFPFRECDFNINESREIKRIAHSNKFRRWNQTYDVSGIVECLDTPSGGGSQPCIITGQKLHGVEIIQRPHGYNKGGTKDLPCLRSSCMEHNDFVKIVESRCDEGMREFGGNVCGSLRTTDSGGDKRVIKGSTIRRITPVETERLQGFMDGWTATGIDDDGNEVKISDTQRYRQMGNAISVPIVEMIARRLLDES